MKPLSLLPAALALLLMAGCKKPAPASPAADPQANLKVESVHLTDVRDALDLPGRVEADPAHLVHIYAPLSGRLLDLSITPGQEVHRGQTLAMLQSSDVAQARTEFEKARIETIRADHALERGKLLLAHEVLSQADFEELEATASAAHAEQERTRQRIHELGFAESGTSDTAAVTSPITGTVLETSTASGEMQRSLETTNGIATVANLDNVWVTGDVFERDLGAVHLHDTVSLSFAAYPGQSFRGSIANIGDSFDPATHAVKARIVLANPQHRLKPAMFATLHIERPPVSRIMLPVAAVLHDGGTTGVYLPAPNGKYVFHEVTAGETRDGRIEILSGLRDGDRVVTEGAAFLREPVGD